MAGLLFAPEAARPHLFALYAFNAEVARIREHVSQPILGEMRLQWWIDTLESDERGDVQVHPTADALLATINKLNLPRPVFRDLLEARRFDMYDDPAPDVGFLEAYCGETCSALFRLASLILGATATDADAAGYAGCAYAMTGLSARVAWLVANQQCYIPRDLLARHCLTSASVLAREKSPKWWRRWRICGRWLATISPRPKRPSPPCRKPSAKPIGYWPCRSFICGRWSEGITIPSSRWPISPPGAANGPCGEQKSSFRPTAKSSARNEYPKTLFSSKYKLVFLLGERRAWPTQVSGGPKKASFCTAGGFAA